MGLGAKVAEAIAAVGKTSIGQKAASAFDSAVDIGVIKYHKKAFKPIEFIPGTHYTLNKAIGVPLGIAVGGLAMKKDQMSDVKDARLSDMQADEMSNMINVSRSPGIDSYENRRNPEKNTPEEIKEIRRQTPFGLRDGNAAGDLVFALHDLKNGGR